MWLRLIENMAYFSRQKREPLPAWRGLSSVMLSKIRLHAQEQHEDLIERSQSSAALNALETRTQRRFIQQWGVDELQLQNSSNEVVKKWFVPNLSGLLSWHLEENDVFRRLMLNAVRALPVGADLRIICYADEAIPGNPLNPTRGRTLYNFFASIVEFRQGLTNCSAWIPIASIFQRIWNKWKVESAKRTEFSWRKFLVQMMA